MSRVLSFTLTRECVAGHCAKRDAGALPRHGLPGGQGWPHARVAAHGRPLACVAAGAAGMNPDASHLEGAGLRLMGGPLHACPLKRLVDAAPGSRVLAEPLHVTRQCTHVPSPGRADGNPHVLRSGCEPGSQICSHPCPEPGMRALLRHAPVWQSHACEELPSARRPRLWR